MEQLTGKKRAMIGRRGPEQKNAEKGNRRRLQSMFIGMLSVLALTLTSLFVTGDGRAEKLPAPSVVCGDIYGVEQSGAQRVFAVNPSDGSISIVAEFSTSAKTINGLALDGRTGTFWAVEQSGTGKSGSVTEPKIYSLVAGGSVQTFKGTSVAVSPQRGEMIMGAFDVRSGIYFYGHMSEGSVHIYGFDTNTLKPLDGLVAIVPLEYGTNGDFAFDSYGHLFIVSDKHLYAISDPIPTVGSVNPPSLNAKVVAEISQDIYGAAAFDGKGRLNVGTGDGKVRVIDPASGVTLSTLKMDTNSRISDFASCAQPYTLELTKNLPEGRVNTEDQFELRIEGGGLKNGNVGLTSGTASGIQDENPDNYAGPVAVLPGAEYVISESSSGDSSGNSEYSTTWSCQLDGAIIAEGTGTSGTVVVPDRGASGASISCVFTNTMQKSPPEEGLSQWKSSQPQTGTAVRAGQEITYMLHLDNNSDIEQAVNNTDDLKNVLNNAELVAEPTSSHPGISVGLEGEKLTLNGTIPAHTNVLVEYTVRVKPLAKRTSDILRNELAYCSDDKPCVTEHPLQRLAIKKSVSISEASLNYLVTVTNVGGADYTETAPATMIDDLSEALSKNVEYLNNATSSTGTVTYTAPKIRWSGALKIGETATISYSVDRPDALGGAISNKACVPLPGEEDECAVVVTPIPRVRSAIPNCDERSVDGPECLLDLDPEPKIRKTSNPESGSSVKPGDIVTYILTITNPSVEKNDTDVPVEYIDYLSEVLDDTDLVEEPVSSDPNVVAQLDSDKIHVNGTVLSGASVTVTYKVKVKDVSKLGDRSIKNMVIKAGEKPRCETTSSLCTIHTIRIPPQPDPAVGGATPQSLVRTGIPALWIVSFAGVLVVVGIIFSAWSRLRK